MRMCDEDTVRSLAELQRNWDSYDAGQTVRRTRAARPGVPAASV